MEFHEIIHCETPRLLRNLNDFFDLSSKMGQNAVLISSKILYDRQKLTRRTRAIARFDLFRGGYLRRSGVFFPVACDALVCSAVTAPCVFYPSRQRQSVR